MKKFLKVSLVIIIAFLGLMWYLYSSVDFSPDYLVEKVIKKNYPTTEGHKGNNPTTQAKFEKYLSKENSNATGTSRHLRERREFVSGFSAAKK